MVVSSGCCGLSRRVEGLSGSVVGSEEVQLRVEVGIEVVRGFVEKDVEGSDRSGAGQNCHGVDHRRSSILFLDRISAAVTYNKISMKEQGAEAVEIKISNRIELEITIIGHNKSRISLLKFSLVFFCSFYHY